MLYLSLLRNLEGIELMPLDGAGKPIDGANGEPMAFKMPAPGAAGGLCRRRSVDSLSAEHLPRLSLPAGILRLPGQVPVRRRQRPGHAQGAAEDTLKQVRGLELRFDIRKSGIMRMRPTLDNVKLFTPIANLFKHDALPIRLDGKQDEYLLLPAKLDLETAVCSRWKPSPAGSRRPRLSGYVPFESFEHDPVSTCPTAVRITASASASLLHDGLDTYLSFGIRHTEAHETLSIELMCTNQNLPRKLKLATSAWPAKRPRSSSASATSPRPRRALRRR
jgi:type VI secretion system protein ImpG